ncbi:hypothetical protein AGLY_000824 [Aphis glycines]|uniref:RING-type domain-containing protein n=1 Tax=Aphis glycines TaxID=307491 RepID=A0A6G0U829_APHGL|nr:hypothetical protein AGLY_000824 [Aphis glycines]
MECINLAHDLIRTPVSIHSFDGPCSNHSIYSYTVCREICSEREEFSKMFNSKPEYFEQLSYENSKVLLEIDTVQCGVMFGTFYPHLVTKAMAVRKEKAVEECTEVLVALAQRGSAVLDPKITWLPILQCLLNLQSHDHLQKVLDNSDLNLATEMHLLLNSSTIAQGTVEHFRNLIMGLIDKCQYEQDVLKFFETLLHGDLHSKLADAINVAKKSVSNPTICSSCNQNIIMEPMFVFRCGHGFHSNCLGLNTTCTYCSYTQDRAMNDGFGYQI